VHADVAGAPGDDSMGGGHDVLLGGRWLLAGGAA